MTEPPPKVFISYSYDSPEHEEWVLQFAKQLRANGVDVMLDKWHFPLGKPSAMDMNNAMATSDRVLCICTDRYVRRVDEGKGGAGYEGYLITAELVKDSSTDKFVPVIRNVTGSKKVPACLDGRNRVDLSDPRRYESEFERLLRDLHRAVEIPPLGKNPFLRTSPDTVPLDTELLESADKESAPLGLSEQAKKLLKEAARDPNGRILCYRADQGTIFMTNNQQFESDNPRVQATWENGFQELERYQLIKAQGGKRIEFKVTVQGFDLADGLD